MKTRDFDIAPRREPRTRSTPRKTPDGMNFGLALLGGLCVVGVFGILALLFHLG